jgi:hypothetical protein
MGLELEVPRAGIRSAPEGSDSSLPGLDPVGRRNSHGPKARIAEFGLASRREQAAAARDLEQSTPTKMPHEGLRGVVPSGASQSALLRKGLSGGGGPMVVLESAAALSAERSRSEGASGARAAAAGAESHGV